MATTTFSGTRMRFVPRDSLIGRCDRDTRGRSARLLRPLLDRFRAEDRPVMAVDLSLAKWVRNPEEQGPI